MFYVSFRCKSPGYLQSDSSAILFRYPENFPSEILHKTGDISRMSFRCKSPGYLQPDSSAVKKIRSGSRPGAAPVVERLSPQSSQSFGPASTRDLPSSLPVNFSKFLMKRPARSLAFSSHWLASAYVSRGSRMAGSTPGSSVGTSNPK